MLSSVRPLRTRSMSTSRNVRSKRVRPPSPFFPSLHPSLELPHLLQLPLPTDISLNLTSSQRKPVSQTLTESAPSPPTNSLSSIRQPPPTPQRTLPPRPPTLLLPLLLPSRSSRYRCRTSTSRQTRRSSSKTCRTERRRPIWRRSSRGSS
jgi:hypothetical protein